MPMSPRRSRSHPSALAKKKFALSWLQAISLVTRHELRIAAKDTILIEGRFIQVHTSVQV